MEAEVGELRCGHSAILPSAILAKAGFRSPGTKSPVEQVRSLGDVNARILINVKARHQNVRH
jgi:hypothetical protein